MSRFWLAFLVGWLIKQAILKIGGARLFESSRPFFAGIVIGQTVILTIWVLVNILIYWRHGGTFDPQWSTFFHDLYSS